MGIQSDVSCFDRVFVGGLPHGTTEDSLRAAFSDQGSEVGAITLVRNRVTGLPRGFAFVALLVRFDASVDPHALDGLAHTTIDGRGLDIRGVPDRPPAPAAE